VFLRKRRPRGTEQTECRGHFCLGEGAIVAEAETTSRVLERQERAIPRFPVRRADLPVGLLQAGRWY
jgi:hypothetical protein